MKRTTSQNGNLLITNPNIISGGYSEVNNQEGKTKLTTSQSCEAKGRIQPLQDRRDNLMPKEIDTAFYIINLLTNSETSKKPSNHKISKNNVTDIHPRSQTC